MATTIHLNKSTQNTSLQIGDTAYYVPNVSSTVGIKNSTEVPILIGGITSFSRSSDSFAITIQDNSNTNDPVPGDFIMFQKDRNVNNTSLLGYYAEVKLKNNSTEKAELFALSSEINASSK